MIFLRKMCLMVPGFYRMAIVTTQKGPSLSAWSTPALVARAAPSPFTQASGTFHGRDIFAPVGAHLARGVALHELGTSLDPQALQRIDVQPPERHGSRIDVHI